MWYIRQHGGKVTGFKMRILGSSSWNLLCLKKAAKLSKLAVRSFGKIGGSMRKSTVLLKTFVLLLCLVSWVRADSVLSLEANRSVYSNDLNRIVQEKTRMMAAALQIYSEGLASSRIAYVRSSNLDGVKAVDRAIGCLSALGEVVETLYTTNIVAQYKERERFANLSFDKSHLTLLDLYQKSLAKTLRVVMVSNDLARTELIDAEIKNVNTERSEIASRIKLGVGFEPVRDGIAILKRLCVRGVNSGRSALNISSYLIPRQG